MLLKGRVAAVDRMLVAIDGFGRPLAARMALSGEIAMGDEVRVDIPSDEVLVFPAADQ